MKLSYSSNSEREFRDHQNFQRFVAFRRQNRRKIVGLFTFFEREIQTLQKHSVLVGIYQKG